MIKGNPLKPCFNEKGEGEEHRRMVLVRRDIHGIGYSWARLSESFVRKRMAFQDMFGLAYGLGDESQETGGALTSASECGHLVGCLQIQSADILLGDCRFNLSRLQL